MDCIIVEIGVQKTRGTFTFQLNSSFFPWYNFPSERDDYMYLEYKSCNMENKRSIAKLSPAQSNSNSVGWAEIALISTFTHPQGKYREGNFNTIISQI